MKAIHTHLEGDLCSWFQWDLIAMIMQMSWSLKNSKRSSQRKPFIVFSFFLKAESSMTQFEKEKENPSIHHLSSIYISFCLHIITIYYLSFIFPSTCLLTNIPTYLSTFWTVDIVFSLNFHPTLSVPGYISLFSISLSSFVMPSKDFT